MICISQSIAPLPDMEDIEQDYGDMTSWCDAMTSSTTDTDHLLAPMSETQRVAAANGASSAVLHVGDKSGTEVVDAEAGAQEEAQVELVIDNQEGLPAIIETEHAVDEVVGGESTAGLRNGAIYDLYQPHIVNPLKDIRDARGQQERPLIIASCCSGMAPESRFGQLLDLDLKHIWTNDIKASSYRWIQSNGPDAPHHWADMCEMADKMEIKDEHIIIKAKCVHHGTTCEQVVEKGEMDCLSCGASCKPFSLPRHGRLTLGSKAHKDEKLIAKWAELLGASESKTGLLENVAGFMLPESASDPASPLKRLIEYMSEVAPEYSIVSIILQGSTYMVFSRRRIYVCAIHKSVGGAAAAAKLKYPHHLILIFPHMFEKIIFSSGDRSQNANGQ